MTNSSLSYYYKIVIDGKDKDVEAIQNYIEEQVENVILNHYSFGEQQYIFFETNLQPEEIQESLPDLENEGCIEFINSSENFENDKIIVYFTMIPKFLQDGKNFDTLMKSFLGFFKFLEIIPSILYCVRCQNSNDANRLIAFTREICFDDDLSQTLFIDSDILKLPIMQVLPINFNAKCIQAKYDYKIMYHTVYKESNIFVFDSYENSESFKNKFNGAIIKNEIITVHHFVDNSTYSQLEKYQVRFKISDLLQSQNNKSDDDLKIYRRCYSNLKKIGKVLMLDIDEKNHAKVIFENESDAEKLVKSQKINAQYVNNSIYLCGLPPDTTETSLKSDLAKSSILLNNIEEYVLEPSDIKEISTKKFTFPIFKLHFTDISEVESVLNKIKKMEFNKFIPFSFSRKDEFTEIFNNITSSNTILISGLTNKSSPLDVANECKKYGTIKFFLHIKHSKNSSVIATYSKTNEFKDAKKDLNIILFVGSHIAVKNFSIKQSPDNYYDFNLIKKSSYEQKKQQYVQKLQSQNETNKKASQANKKAQESQVNKKAQSISRQQSLPSSSIKIEKNVEKQIKLEINKSLIKLKLEPLPPRIAKKTTLTVFPASFIEEEDDVDENEPVFH